MLEPLLWFCKTFLPLRATGSSLFQLPVFDKKKRGQVSRERRSGCGFSGLTISETCRMKKERKKFVQVVAERGGRVGNVRK